MFWRVSFQVLYTHKEAFESTCTVKSALVIVNLQSEYSELRFYGKDFISSEKKQ